MTSGSYTLHELFASRDVEQLLVPEIQRDYVWGPKQLTILLEDLRQAANQWVADAGASPVPGLDAEMFQAFREYQSRQVHSHGIGFIYAYQDPAYPGKALLIDGQQCLTTLYLLLLAAALRQGFAAVPRDHFQRFYLWRDAAKLDYRVRESAHTFLERFVRFLLDGGAARRARYQYWYFADYDEDGTIRNLIANYEFLATTLARPEYEALSYDYLREYVHFQYFDTNLSTQGEELYLSLNSTGHPTEDNENIRALLLEREPPRDRERWGRQWEEWQDFFWQHRGGNANADYGFNEFLRWLWIVCLHEGGKGGLANQLAEDKGSLWELAEDAGASMADVARVFEAVRYVHKALAAAPRFFGADWLAGGAPARQQLTQRKGFRLLTLLRYVLSRPVEPRPAALMLHRQARHFYNVSRIKSSFGTRPSTHFLSAMWLAQYLGTRAEDFADLLDLPMVAHADFDTALLPAEELWKLRQYRSPPIGATREQLETLFWDLEDDACNQGEVAHLFPEVNFTGGEPAALVPERLQTVSRAYAELFPAGKAAAPIREAQQRLLQSVLLDYGVYWPLMKPDYYDNCAFGEWHNTVRRAAFTSFFREFVRAGLSLTAFYQTRRRLYFASRTLEQLRAVTTVREQLFILAALFYELAPGDFSAAGMWRYGNRIGYKTYLDRQSNYPFFTRDICYRNAQTYPYKDGNVLNVVDFLASAAGTDPEVGVETLVNGLLAQLSDEGSYSKG